VRLPSPVTLLFIFWFGSTLGAWGNRESTCRFWTRSTVQTRRSLGV